MKAFPVLIFSLSIAFATAGQNLTGSDTANKGLTGTWKLLEFKNLDSGQITDTTEVQDDGTAFYKKVRLTFRDSADIGKIQGYSFCNMVDGKYTLYEKNKIAVTTFGGTKMTCLYEDKLWHAFRTATSYRRTNDYLFILYNDDSDEMVFVRDK